MSRIEYHLRQYDEMYRSTDSFIDFVDTSTNTQPASILDIGCGAGANVHWFNQAFPEWDFTGIDIDPELIEIARDRNDDVPFRTMGFESVLDEFGTDSYDYVFSLQFISFVDVGLAEFVDTCCEVARDGVFFTSLFSEGMIEQETIARNLADGWSGTYSVYSLPRLEEHLEIVPDSDVHYRSFDIDTDLPKPDEPKFETYTVITESGERLQISGHMLLPWYEVYIDLT